MRIRYLLKPEARKAVLSFHYARVDIFQVLLDRMPIGGAETMHDACCCTGEAAESATEPRESLRSRT